MAPGVFIETSSAGASRRSRGTILIAVMLIVMLAAMVAASLMYRMRAEVAASAATDRGEQAYQAAMSGLQTALMVLRTNPDPTVTYDNPALFQNQLVYNDGSDQWYFSIFADPDPTVASSSSSSLGSSGSSLSASSSSSDDGSAPVRYGLTDEAGRLNLNVVDATTLGNLPGVTPDLAAALVAYRGSPGVSMLAAATTQPTGAVTTSPIYGAPTPSPYLPSSASTAGGTTAGGTTAGADTVGPSAFDTMSGGSGGLSSNGQNYYDQLSQPYFMPGGPLSSVDELLLVKGFTPQIVYGQAFSTGVASDNPIAADNSDQSPSSSGTGSDADSSSFTLGASQTVSPDAPTNVIDPGLLGLTTVYSYDLNVNSQGQPRLNLNTAGATQLTAAGLSTQTVQFITQYLADGNTFSDPSELLNMQYTPATTQPASATQPGLPMSSGVTTDNLAQVMDALTAGTPGAMVPGLININTAPEAVLAAIPGIGDSIAQQIVGVRGNLDPQTRATTAWLVAQNLVDPQTYQSIAPRLTARGYQFHLHCVGFGWPSGRYCMIEAVIDIASGTPRVVYLRDTTRLGLPFDLDAGQLGTQATQATQTPNSGG